LLMAACSLPSTTPGTAGFPNGVAAGDVTDSGAIVWTRTSAEASVDLDVYDAVGVAGTLLLVPGATPIFTTSSTLCGLNSVKYHLRARRIPSSRRSSYNFKINATS